MKDRKESPAGPREARPADPPGSPEPDTLEGPGGRHEEKGEEDARNKTTRRGER